MAVQIQRPDWFVSHAWIEPCLGPRFLESEFRCVFFLELENKYLTGKTPCLWL